MTTSPTNEQELLAQVRTTTSPANGDDAAVVAVPSGTICISTDATVEGVHAPRATTAHDLGRRAVARALSDLAAMGALPVAATCAQTVPGERWDAAASMASGAHELARERGCAVVGGDLTQIPGAAPLSMVVTVVGVPTGARGSFVPRSGARAGDVVVLTGELGAAGRALRAGHPVLPEPPDRLRAGALLAPLATSMIDLSDGLATDAQHLAHASGCTLRIDIEALPLAPGVTDPVHAACDGDDYELLLTMAPDDVDRARARIGEVSCTAIGVVTDGDPVAQLHHNGVACDELTGFVHGATGTRGGGRGMQQ